MSSLIYKIKADGSGYTKTVSKLRNDTKKFGSDVKGEFTGIGTAMKGAFAFVGLSQLQGVTREFVEMSRQAKNLGVGVEEFQKLSMVAADFGINSETLGDAIKDLNVRIHEGAVEGGGMAEEFAQLGMDVDKLARKMPIEQFYALSDAVKEAGGNMGRMGLDRINDAAFRMGPIMALGSEEIKKQADAFDGLTQAQLDNLEVADKFINRTATNIKLYIAESISGFSADLDKFKTKMEQILADLEKSMGGSGKPKPKIFESKPGFMGLFGGMQPVQQPEDDKNSSEDAAAQAAEEAALSSALEAKTKEEAAKESERINKIEADTAKLQKQAAAEVQKAAMIGASDEKILSAATAKRVKLQKELNLFRDDFNDSAEHENEIAAKELEIKKAITTENQAQHTVDENRKVALDSIKRKIEEIAAMQKDVADMKIEREEADLSPEERLEKSVERRKKLEEELAQLRKDTMADGVITPDEALAALAKRLELEEAINEEKNRGDIITSNEQDARENVAETKEQIAAERKAREEMGMSDEEILARRKSELQQKEQEFAGLGEDANGDGTIDAADPQFRAEKELDIENLKTEIKGLELGGIEPDTQASVISSQLAAIGGGGATASFTNDPILNENKRQSNLLEQLVKLQGGTLEGGGNIPTPEL